MGVQSDNSGLKKLRLWRVTYRAKIGALSVVGELNIKTKKEKWEIDFEKVVETYLEANGRKARFEEVIFDEEIPFEKEKVPRIEKK